MVSNRVKLCSLPEEDRQAERKRRKEERDLAFSKLSPEEQERRRIEKRLKQKKYRENNPEKVKQSKQQDYDKNKDKYCAYQKQYREDNQEYLQQYWSRFYELNQDTIRERSRIASQKRRDMFPEEMKAYQKQYQLANKEALRQQAKEYRQNNFEQVSAREKQWCKANPDKKRVTRKASAVNRRKAPGRITGKDVSDLHQINDDTCAYCLNPLSVKSHLDHVLPLSRGGCNQIDNIVVSCADCNLHKGTKTPLEFVFDWNRVTKRYDFTAD